MIQRAAPPSDKPSCLDGATNKGNRIIVKQIDNQLASPQAQTKLSSVFRPLFPDKPRIHAKTQLTRRQQTWLHHAFL